jgi:hypothetical protein
MRRIVLLILMFCLMALCESAETGEFTLLYSNDTGGVIDPCPT